MPSAVIPPKRLVICCDGTWQSSTTGTKNIPSNVTRLARSIAREGTDRHGKVWQQLVHYDAGIGTGEISKSEKDRQGGFGVGFVGNVIEAYNFLVLNYSPGDKIYCFGFSRGAYTARAVAGLVNDIGIVPPRDMQDFPDLFALYQKNTNSNGFRRSKAYREWVTGVKAPGPPDETTGLPRYIKPPHTPVEESSRVVEVVGVFDTVGSLGIPDTPYHSVDLAMKFFGWRMGATEAGFHNVSLSPYIRNAFHALALDERRGPFTPTLWHLRPEGSVAGLQKPKQTSEKLLAQWKKVYWDEDATDEDRDKIWKEFIDCQMYEHMTGTGSQFENGLRSKLLQVWFPGCHINIGGGSDDLLNEKKGDLEQIALISFAWMCEQIKPLLQLEEDIHIKAVKDRMDLIVPALAEIAAGETKDFSDRSVPSFWRALDYTGIWKAEAKKIPASTVFGWATGPIPDSFEGGVRLAGSKTRTPGGYRYVEQENDEVVDLGETNEQIHPSVFYRKKKLGYTPEPLKGFERRFDKTAGFQWVHKESGLTIPEYRIAADDVFTRHVASSDGKDSDDNASKFLHDTDREWAKLSKPVNGASK